LAVDSAPQRAVRPPTDDVLALVYEELRRLARRQRRGMHEVPTLNTTALVHEAYLKLGKSPHIAGLERSHFFAVAARAMRQILVDQSRRHRSRRVSGQITATTGWRALAPSMEQSQLDMVALDRALAELSALDPRIGETVELRVFAGLDVAEIAELQGVTTRTVARDWRRACAFLINELELAAATAEAG
jgi:RNA polymerase sigma factor (TIGR02999 family)